jgi:hypothetical protein
MKGYKMITRIWFNNRDFELWLERGRWYAQDVLCRGIVGSGKTKNAAMSQTIKKLGQV